MGIPCPLTKQYFWQKNGKRPKNLGLQVSTKYSEICTYDPYPEVSLDHKLDVLHVALNFKCPSNLLPSFKNIK
jgi:hypothetical protein